MKRLTAEYKAELAPLLLAYMEDGGSIKGAADLYGHSRATITKLLRELNREDLLPKPGMPAYKIAEIEGTMHLSMTEIIEAARAEGMGQKALAEKLGLSGNYLRYICDCLNLKPLGRGDVKPGTPMYEAAAAARAKLPAVQWEYDGRVQRLIDWAKEWGVPKSTARYRLLKWGSKV